MPRPAWTTRHWWSREAVIGRLYDEHGRRYTGRDITPLSIGILGLVVILSGQLLRLVGLG
jgi:hypothetical protein